MIEIGRLIYILSERPKESNYVVKNSYLLLDTFVYRSIRKEEDDGAGSFL